MATLTELYDRVRAQTETDESELADSRINEFLEEAFNRTIAGENSWPFYEETWTLTQLVGESTLALPSDCNQPGIVSLFDLTDNRRLEMIDYGTAEDFYLGVVTSVAGPIQYSLWGGEIQLWPATEFTATREYRLRGFRRAAAWSSLGAGSEPDCDERLHLPLLHYAVALAYAQQEDEVLEANYMARWQRDVEMARQAIMEPTRHRPVQMGPQFSMGIGRSRSCVIDTP